MGICKTCELPYYNDGAANECKPCNVIKNCKACSSDTVCLACETGYWLKDGNCTACNLTNCDACSSMTLCDQCKGGFYWNTSTLACTACHTGCKYCSKYEECHECSVGYYKDTAKFCQACVANCDVCADKENCTTCAKKFYTYDKKCFDCDKYCGTCQGAGAKNCTTCVVNGTWADAASVSLGECVCISAHIYDATLKVCIKGTESSHGSYYLTGILTFLVILLAIF
jgi:proprotein convertase subtilisin/kexin type 5